MSINIITTCRRWSWWQCARQDCPACSSDNGTHLDAFGGLDSFIFVQKSLQLLRFWHVLRMPALLTADTQTHGEIAPIL